jgi:UDP-glucose 4-epimerase
MIKNVLILGGSGMIGNSITQKFLSENINVINFDIKSSNISHSLYKQIIDSYENITNYFDIVDKCYLLIHLISLSNPLEDRGFDEEFNKNISPTIKLLTYLSKSKKNIFFFSSGGTVYGDSTEHNSHKETDLLNPISAYAKYKVLLEQIFIANKHKHNLKIFRVGNAYGGFENINSNQGVISIAIKKIMLGESILLYNKGELVRDFIYTEDLAIIVYKFLSVKSNEVIFNLSSGEGKKISLILKTISEQLKIAPKFLHKESEKIIHNNVLDCSKLHKYIDFKEFTKLEVAIKKMIEDFCGKN